jgi:hypothetical protein
VGGAPQLGFVHGVTVVRDDGRMDYEVSLTEVESRPAAVVAAATTWQEFPALWGQLLGEVWTEVYWLLS